MTTATFPSKAAQKDAVERVSRQYDRMRMDEIHNWEVPYSLCHWRDAKHAKFVSPEQLKRIRELVAQRAALVAIPVVKPPPANSRRARRPSS
jgi:hypothetical protein